ncbi:MAG: alanine-glyoxylate transaminase [Monoraphidium minutum]|nr:MAG: alanine-glyoxylate transaminase [Monoraphidium minutum]
MVLSVARLLRQPLAQALPWLQCSARGFSAAPEKATDLPQMPAFNYKPLPYSGPSKDEVIALRKKFLSPAMFWHFKEPVMVVEGKMQYLFDERGKRYLDAFAGIVTVSVGHCHPDVVAAVNAQNQVLQHTTTIYLNHQIAEYAKELADRMPGNLKVVYFVNSGSEANDMAMMLARAYTGNYDIIALRNAYHGLSGDTMGLCGQHTWKQPVPQGFGVKHALNPDPYRGAFGNDGKKYAEDVADVIRGATTGRVAGFFSETIQGVGGAVALADGYLPEAYRHVRDAGGVCIADEVQTGFGRTGDAYWGFQLQGVMPDIVTMAKGIGNGLPLAAVVTTPEVAAALTKRIHFNTFGGNPMCSAGGRAVLRVIDRERIQEHCKDVGTHLLGRLHALQEKHAIIGDVRGRGLMVGLELVKDRATKEPATPELNVVFEAMKDAGVLMGKGGLYGNVFRIKPPMCFSAADADFLVDVMDHCLGKL